MSIIRKIRSAFNMVGTNLTDKEVDDMPEEIKKKEELETEEVKAEEAPVEEAPVVEDKSEDKVEDKVEEVVKEEEVKEEPAPVAEPALKESDAVSKLLAQQELLMKQNEELQKKLEDLSKEKSLIDSQKKLDEAMAEGWLTPAMLKENAEGAESVFVTLAKDYPEMFERLKLVMAPKVMKKSAMTEDSSAISEVMNDDEAKFEMISKFAAENKIPYIEAARKIGGLK